MDAITAAFLREDPSLLMEMAGLDQPDTWQRTLMRSKADRILLLCSRQLGKSTTCAFVALAQAYLVPGSLILISSKTEKQSAELFAKVAMYHSRLSLVPTTREMVTTLEMSNGSRIIALCGEGDNFRGYSAPQLCLVDEASIVDESVLVALLPMLLMSKGRLIALTTPHGKIGWFYSQWISEDPSWERITAKAADSPRVDKKELAKLKVLGQRHYDAEAECIFVESDGQLFSDETIDDITNYSGSEGIMPALRGI
jgi:hypothetical protein